MKISAYLSVYNDWDFLRPSIESILPLIDELVIVDGAYQWMSEYLIGSGQNPRRSNHRVYHALSNFDVNVKIINGVWENERQKRATGYAACSHQYIMRIDSDEIITVNKSALSSFIQTGAAVAEMEIPPICHTPGWIEITDQYPGIPRVGFLFDRNQINARQHLDYLWILSSSNDAPAGPKLPVMPLPVAQAVHMTTWRSPEGSANRAAFYVLSYIKEHGCPWLHDEHGNPNKNLSELFSKTHPINLQKSLLFSAQCCSDFDLDGKKIVKSPFDLERQKSVKCHHEFFLHSHASRNAAIAHEQQWLIQGQLARIDLSTPEAIQNIIPKNLFHIQFNKPVKFAYAEISILQAHAPFSQKLPLSINIFENVLKIEIKPSILMSDAIRKLLRFVVSVDDPAALQSFYVV